MLQDALTELHVSGTCKPTQKAFFKNFSRLFLEYYNFSSEQNSELWDSKPSVSLYSTQKLSTRWRYITLLFPFCYDVLWMYNELSTLSWLNMPDITICHGPGRAGFISLLFPLLYSQCYSYSGCKFLSVERLKLIPWGETKTQIPTCKILKFNPQTHWRLFCLLSPQPPHINIQCHAPLSGSVTDFNVVRPHFLN